MEISSFDPFLLVTSRENSNFGMVRMQIDNTIILVDEGFSVQEEEQLLEAKFVAKPKERLTLNTPLAFNGYTLALMNDSKYLELNQKEQGNKIELINVTDENFKHSYVQQRACGPYLISVCQPQVSFDPSVAAQHQNTPENDVMALNKRPNSKMKNLNHGLKYIPLDTNTRDIKLSVFVDGSFANNRDFSSQIGFEVMLANETSKSSDKFEICGNMIHWSPTKSKKVIQNVWLQEFTQ